MDAFRRDFLKLAGSGIMGVATTAVITPGASAQKKLPVTETEAENAFNVKTFGAVGDGKTIDTPSVNRAIEAANAAGGGIVRFPAGTYACYSIHLKSNVALYLEDGATLLAADVPPEGTSTGGYDAAEPNTPWEHYQDYGHNHWHNSLLWGENIHNVAILGSGLIWGKGLSRGVGREKPRADAPGVGNKAIALKNCYNVIFRDFSILQGGHFGIWAAGVDNLTIDNLKIDTNRDGMDIDCCRNVRVSNCSVNSPWDDGICPKSSYALGYPRATENVTITNCYVTGAYELGTMLDGTWKRLPANTRVPRTGRIKCGTESNGGFKNITISNCVFDGCRGFALESVDGALLEDITFTGITMRDCTNTPMFLRLGSRMRGPEGVPVGTLKRIIISNVVSYNSVSQYTGGGIISGIPGHPIEDVKINDVYVHYRGNPESESIKGTPPEDEEKYPEPRMFGPLPAQGFFVRHVKNIEFTNVEVACDEPDSRPLFWLNDVEEADFFRIKTPKKQRSSMFNLQNVRDFRVTASRGIRDIEKEKIDQEQL